MVIAIVISAVLAVAAKFAAMYWSYRRLDRELEELSKYCSGAL